MKELFNETFFKFFFGFLAILLASFAIIIITYTYSEDPGATSTETEAQEVQSK